MRMKKQSRKYTLSIATEKEIIKAEKLQSKLYDQFESVTVKPIGLCKIEIIATDN